LDVCPVCRVGEVVSSKKKVYPCSYCERWFCKKHLEPKVSVFSPTQVTIKDLAWKDFIRRNWKNKDGHPDYVSREEAKKGKSSERESGVEIHQVQQEHQPTAHNVVQKDRGLRLMGINMMPLNVWAVDIDGNAITECLQRS